MRNKCTDEAAVAEAVRLLYPLIKDIASWQTDINSPELKLGAAIALVEQALAEAEAALTDCPLRSEIDKAAADALVFVQLARQRAIPELKQARPRLRRRGHPQNIARDELIRTAVKEIRKLGKTKEEAIIIVTETLPKLIPDKIGEASVRDIIKGKRKKIL